MPNNELDLTVLDENDEEIEDPKLLINGQEVGGGGGDGATEDATYITVADESDDLSESEQHSELANDDLHEPAEHDNDAHSLAFLSDGDGVRRQVWLIPAGADDPEEADPEDIILEEED